jgi:hypothetical protein
LQPKAGMDCYGFIKDNFHKLNGKIYRPQENGNYLILALMKKEAKDIGVQFGDFTSSEIGKNDALKTDLESYFHVNQIQELKEDLVIEDIPNVGSLEKNTVTCKKNGVLMVMMENYDTKSKNFLSAGVIAVALKDTLESKEIIENLFKLRYILFHTWKEEGKHLFMVENINIVAKGDVGSNVYKTVKPDNKNVTEYVLVSFNNDFELMSDGLHPISKSVHTRYDAQYSILENLKSEPKQQTKIE